jgi:hypothetical protein
VTTRLLTERAADLGGFSRVKAAGHALPFTPLELVHIYVRLDFKLQYECARTADDARGFLRSVARAATVAHRLAERYHGGLVEVQGSTLHATLPRRTGVTDAVREYVADVHWAYRTLFNDSGSRVEGWRMTVDAGKTLVVAGRGVHGDDSWVSLGKSANRPAKYLHAQLELPEVDRDLKRFHVGVRDPDTGRWDHQLMDRLPARLQETKSIAEEAQSAAPAVDFLEANGGKRPLARALPIGPAGTPSSPSAERPHTYFGWVMRADLDGFTARVEECFDNDQKLQELAVEFYGVMDAAAQFAGRHTETLAQLPWAGDNFTAAAVFSAKDDYERAIPRRLVELSLDFEKELAESAIGSGFGGWAHGVAGGTVQGNAGGNVYLGSVLVRGRRFLVGAGEGFGRSAQAFGDINPKSKEVVVYEPDWTRLEEPYRNAFEPAVTHRGEQSTLYRAARIDALLRVRARSVSVAVPTIVSVAPGHLREMAVRPYFA